MTEDLSWPPKITKLGPIEIQESAGPVQSASNPPNAEKEPESEKKEYKVPDAVSQESSSDDETSETTETYVSDRGTSSKYALTSIMKVYKSDKLKYSGALTD